MVTTKREGAAPAASGPTDTASSSQGESAMMARLGVTFDGRSYWYQDYRYDRLPDAAAYAELTRSRPEYREEALVEHPWRAPELPSEPERQQMLELGITLDGNIYHYETFRYDRLADAVTYASRPRGIGVDRP